MHHLYLHIPFCHRVCPYCSFYKHTPGATDMAGFVQAVLHELRLHQRAMTLAPQTIYLGGGTPTALSETHLATLLHGLRDAFDGAALHEFCLEANPRTIGQTKARMLRECGVTRVSLGVQAWDEPTLHLLGRDHLPDEAVETYYILREAGIPSVNLDFMFSIPQQSLDVWVRGIEKTLHLKPDHVSCYNLTYEEDTDFLAKFRTGELDANEDRDADHFFAALDALTAAGFEHYEISNYAQPGHRSAHNQGYWRGDDYLGLGPSAVSTQQRVRWKNVADT
ncbi:MAG: radical SAM family heme chaperone HemW, partial [Roseimicrobium sp.]